LAYTIIVMPFDSKKDNIIEVMNECIFVTLCLIVTVCNSESSWFGGLPNILILALMINGFLISLVIMVDAIIGWVQHCKKKRREKMTKVEALTPDIHQKAFNDGRNVTMRALELNNINEDSLKNDPQDSLATIKTKKDKQFDDSLNQENVFEIEDITPDDEERNDF
jgi:hypothetical protein